MTKIYLVYFTGWNKRNDRFYTFVLNVFTNKKKAKIYAEYKQLQAEVTKPKWLADYSKVKYKVDECNINNSDYTKDLLELQEKNLPF